MTVPPCSRAGRILDSPVPPVRRWDGSPRASALSGRRGRKTQAAGAACLLVGSPPAPSGDERDKSRRRDKVQRVARGTEKEYRKYCVHDTCPNTGGPALFFVYCTQYRSQSRASRAAWWWSRAPSSGVVTWVTVPVRKRAP